MSGPRRIAVALVVALLLGSLAAMALLLPVLWLLGESSGSRRDESYAAGLAGYQILLVALPIVGLTIRRRRPKGALLAFCAWTLIALPMAVFVLRALWFS